LAARVRSLRQLSFDERGAFNGNVRSQAARSSIRSTWIPREHRISRSLRV